MTAYLSWQAERAISLAEALVIAPPPWVDPALAACIADHRPHRLTDTRRSTTVTYPNPAAARAIDDERHAMLRQAEHLEENHATMARQIQEIAAEIRSRRAEVDDLEEAVSGIGACLAVGFDPLDPETPRSWECTRITGHRGNHAADHNGKLLHVWPQP